MDHITRRTLVTLAAGALAAPALAQEGNMVRPSRVRHRRQGPGCDLRPALRPARCRADAQARGARADARLRARMIRSP